MRMKHDPSFAGKRRPVNVSLDTSIVSAAKEVGINLSQVSEDALRRAVKIEQERRWREEHREQIATYNRWIEENGIPLADLPVL